MQTTIKAQRGWHRSMPLPKQEQAIQYRRILKALGNQTRAPQETAGGWVVRWRPIVKKER